MPERLRCRAPSNIRAAIATERRAAKVATDPWPHLERAHILSQPWAWEHCTVHAAMLRAALGQHDRHEAMGQLVRILVAGPGSLSGRYPPGKNGRSATPLTATAAVPEDLAALLEQTG